MIRNFTDRDTEQLLREEKNRRFNTIARAINEIVHGKRSITPTMSIRFGPFFRQPVRRSLGEGGVDTFC